MVNLRREMMAEVGCHREAQKLAIAEKSNVDISHETMQ